MGKNGQNGHFFCLLTFFVCGTVLFLLGFFPASYSKIESEESGNYLARPTAVNGVKIQPPSKQYGAFILMLIDALRVDFPNITSMPAAYGSACQKLSLHVDIPTVTMPRIKSITTGTLSNFIDIALNIGKAEQLEDSLLHRLKRRGDIISFAGDRTWIELFPSEFERHAENIDSFFVNDFYEGDKNVTKVLQEELKETDWTLLILHYLGLDHIGHVEGSSSEKIKSKLKQMDDVIKYILESKHYPNYLLMLTGDHGMANGGGHGGNTAEEVFVPLYLYSNNCSKVEKKIKEYNQIDLTPTLAILMSLEIPSMSIGCLIPEMLEPLSLEDKLYAYLYNAHHLLNRARIKFGRKQVKKSQYYAWYVNAKLFHQQFLISLRRDGIISNVQYQNAKLDYMRVAREISEHLSESLVKFDYGFIFMGIALTSATSYHAIISVLFLDVKALLKLDHLKFSQLFASFCVALVLNVWSHYTGLVLTSSWLYSFLILVPITVAIYLCVDVLRAVLRLWLPDTRRLKISMPIPLPLLICLGIRTFTLGSSSFIEYEHLTWWYLGRSLIILTAFETLKARVKKANLAQEGRELYSIMPICIWKQRKSGVVLIILTWLSYLTYRLEFKTFLVMFSLFILWARLRKFNNIKQKIIGAAACSLVYCFHGLKRKVFFFDITKSVSDGLELPILVAFWCSLAAIALVGYNSAISKQNFYSSKPQNTLLQLLQTNLTCSLYITALLHKSVNIVLLPALLIVLDGSYKLCETYYSKIRSHYSSVRRVHVYKVVFTIFVAKMFHFYQGNSNSLSTIDLNPGYIGQTSYNPLIVGVLVTLNTYAAEINAFLYLIVHILRTEDTIDDQAIAPFPGPYSETVDSLVIPLYATLTMLPVALYLCLMVGFRYHLFIYSVFSPKVLYDCYSVFVFYLVVIITSLYFKIFKSNI